MHLTFGIRAFRNNITYINNLNIFGELKIMKKIAIALLLLTLVGNSACANNDDIVATYSGGKVSEGQVMSQFAPMLDKQPETKGKKFSDLDKKLQEALIKSYINMKLLRKEADNLGLTKTTDFKHKLENAENVLVQQTLFEHKTKDLITDKAVETEYQDFKNSLKGQKEIQVSHILVDSESKAKEVKEQLKSTSFEKLAEKYSKDEASKVKGGSIGYITKGRLVPEFEEKAFNMKKNEVSDPVKTNFGWHLIKIYDIRDIQIPEKKDIEQELKGKIANDAIMKYIDTLEKDAKIEIKHSN